MKRTLLYYSVIIVVKLKGHKKAVSSLCFNKEGTSLASGSNDCSIVVWDLISETGVCRLKGHRDMVTSLLFIEEYNLLLSSSKDTLLKAWSIDGQYCVDTYIGHRNEIWSMSLFTQPGYKEDDKDTNLAKYNVITGSSDQSLRLFSIYKDLCVFKHEGEESKEDQVESRHLIEYRGCITIQHTGRTGQLLVDPSQTLVGYYNVGKVFMLYRIRSFHEASRKMKRRIRRRKEKGGVAESRVQCSDVLELVSTVNTSHKISSFDFGHVLEASDEIEVLFGLNNNAMQLYHFGRKNAPSKESKNEDDEKGVENTGSFERVLSISLAGHRSDIRAMALTSTDDLLLSVGQKDAKMWTIRSLECVRTIDVENGLCCAILPGDKHAVIGTKDGKLNLIDLNTGDIIQSLQAHKGSIWSVDIRQDGKGMVSGGADHNICFWEFDINVNQVSKKRQLEIVPTRTLKMTHDILCVKYSNTTDPSKLLVAVSLLDNTVKVVSFLWLSYRSSLRILFVSSFPCMDTNCLFFH